MKYTQKKLQVGEKRIIASKVSNMTNWREATEADIKEAEAYNKWLVDNEELAEVGYEKYIQQLIEERYTIQEELAISRQRETKSEEFRIYFEYCESCKVKAKELFPYH